MYKDARGLWRQQVTINGKRKVFSGKSKRDVWLKIAAFEEEEQKKSGLPFDTIAAEWWDEAQNRLQYNTLKSYKPAYDRAVAWFGDTPCGDIQPRDVTAFLKSLTYMSDRVVNNAHVVVRMILAQACQHGLAYNVAQLVKTPKGTGKKPREYPDDEDVAIVNENVNTPFGLFVYVTLWTGLRRGELAGLRWGDIDWQTNTIHVRRALYWTTDKQPHVKEPKTMTGVRDVPLLDNVAALLEPLRASASHYVFGGKQPLTEHQIERPMSAYRRRTGLKCTLHGLRHGYASILFRLGLDIKTVALIMGHAQTSTTLEIYVHLMEQDKLAAARDALNKYTLGAHQPTETQ